MHGLALRSLPSEVRGALVHRVSALPNGPLDVSWLPADAPRLPVGRIRLHWEPASLAGWDVTARLGLVNRSSRKALRDRCHADSIARCAMGKLAVRLLFA
jgi:hypothetical protein